MLTLKEVRKILGKTAVKMSDQDVEKLRSNLYTLINQIVDNHVKEFKTICKKQ